ncbi:hypothetical protein J4Q44_G00299070 [Coregonus suidteri]|uniref:Secreted protein n=1 Tax=Coregonus suidteri TaxID=861788 RepID=A0AAN8KRY8_9TELE
MVLTLGVMWAACLSLFCFPSSLFCPLFVCCICMCVCPHYVGASAGVCRGSGGVLRICLSCAAAGCFQ